MSYRSAPSWGLNERAATRFAEAYKSGLSNSRSLGNSLKNDFKPAASPERLTWPAQPTLANGRRLKPIREAFAGCGSRLVGKLCTAIAAGPIGLNESALSGFLAVL